MPKGKIRIIVHGTLGGMKRLEELKGTTLDVNDKKVTILDVQPVSEKDLEK